MPQEILYTSTGDVSCQSCVTAQQVAEGHKASANMARQLAYGNPFLGAISLFFDPFFACSLGAIGNALYTFRRIRADRARGEDESNPRARKIAAIIGVVLALASLGNRFLSANQARDDGFANQLAASSGVTHVRLAEIAVILQRSFSPLLADPKLLAYQVEQTAAMKRMGTAADDKSLAAIALQRLIARGLPRLADADVVRHAQIQTKMIQASDRACACLATSWACAVPELVAGFAALTDGELSAYMDLRVRAATAELHATDPVTSVDPEAALELGVVPVMRSLGEADRQKFVSVMQKADNYSKAEHCSAMRTLYGGVAMLDGRDRARFSRALALTSMPD